MMRQLLRLNVIQGTGKNADVKGYEVGGKTGTAEKPSRGGYRQKALISSFVGMFPMSEPKFLIVVSLDEPKGTAETGGYATGGMVSAPQRQGDHREYRVALRHPAGRLEQPDSARDRFDRRSPRPSRRAPGHGGDGARPGAGTQGAAGARRRPGGGRTGSASRCG